MITYLNVEIKWFSMRLKKRLKRFVDNYLLFREANVLNLMGELEKMSITEMIKKIPEDKRGKIKGTLWGGDLFYHRAAEILYFENMDRKERIKDFGYRVLDVIVN